MDTGVGISEANKSKLFKSFGKVESAMDQTLNPQGVGLGLVISHRLANFLCSSKTLAGLNVDSVEKKGSNFWFIIDCGTPDPYEIDEDYVVTLAEKLTQTQSLHIPLKK
jgi:signal transduction histidine kinase